MIESRFCGEKERVLARYQVLEERWLWEIAVPGRRLFHLSGIGDNESVIRRDAAVAYGQLPSSREFRLVRSPRDIIYLKAGDGDEVIAAANEVVVGFQQGIKLADVVSFEQQYRLRREYLDRGMRFGIFASNHRALPDLFARLGEDVRVFSLDPNLLDGDPDEQIQDDALSGQEDIDLPTSLWSHAMVGVLGSGLASDGEGVVVAIVDGRMAPDHPALADTYCASPDLPELHFGERLQIVAHGMSCASVVAGQTTLSNQGRIGVAPSAKILPIGISTYSADPYAWRASAIFFLADAARKGMCSISGDSIQVERLVVNCSWKLRSQRPDLAIVQNAFEELVATPAICVCSAGNEGNDDRHLPSDYPGVLSVAALNKSGKRLDRPGVSSNFGARVNFCAPGGTGVPLDEDDIVVATVNQLHAYGIGTSLASPCVAGLLAAIWSRYPSLDNNALMTLVFSEFTRSVDSENPGFEGKLGRLLTIESN